MKALFEKDLRLILIRKSTLVIFLVIGVIFTWSFSSTFSGAYLTMLGTMLALSTISYDDSDNCMSFIFTLPCTRRQYVLEKYIFIYGFSFVAGLVGLLIIVVSSLAMKNPVNEVLIAEILSSELPILVITGGLMIPLQLKFGPEKSRIVLLSLMGIIFAAGYLLSQLAVVGHVLGSIRDAMDNVNPIAAFAGLLGILILLTAVSIMITTRIMDNKEY